MNALTLMEAIFSDASDRRLMDGVDEECVKEIRAEWLKLIEAAMPPAPPTIIVKVDGVPYDTFIDARGVQRFKKNGWLCWLQDQYDFDLNQMSVAFQENKFTKREWMEFNMGLGFSVCGFADLFPSEVDELSARGLTPTVIENPLWTQK